MPTVNNRSGFSLVEAMIAALIAAMAATAVMAVGNNMNFLQRTMNSSGAVYDLKSLMQIAIANNKLSSNVTGERCDTRDVEMPLITMNQNPPGLYLDSSPGVASTNYLVKSGDPTNSSSPGGAYGPLSVKIGFVVPSNGGNGPGLPDIGVFRVHTYQNAQLGWQTLSPDIPVAIQARTLSGHCTVTGTTPTNNGPTPLAVQWGQYNLGSGPNGLGSGMHQMWISFSGEFDTAPQVALLMPSFQWDSNCGNKHPFLGAYVTGVTTSGFNLVVYGANGSCDGWGRLYGNLGWVATGQGSNSMMQASWTAQIGTIPFSGRGNSTETHSATFSTPFDSRPNTVLIGITDGLGSTGCGDNGGYGISTSIVGRPTANGFSVTAHGAGNSHGGGCGDTYLNSVGYFAVGPMASAGTPYVISGQIPVPTEGGFKSGFFPFPTNVFSLAPTMVVFPTFAGADGFIPYNNLCGNGESFFSGGVNAGGFAGFGWFTNGNGCAGVTGAGFIGVQQGQPQ